MKKFIIIGESSLDIDFDGDQPREAQAGGIFLKAACALADTGAPTLFISEIGLDPVGEILASKLVAHGVDISCSDRFAGGLTSTRLSIAGKTIRYDRYPDDEGLDISWPRVERGDVVVIGGYMAIDEIVFLMMLVFVYIVRHRLWAFVENAVEREASIVYVPRLDDDRVARITRVMPTVFENLEAAKTVVTLPGDLPVLYRHDDAAKAFADNIAFYCPSMVAIVRPSTEGPLAAQSFGTAPAVVLDADDDLAAALVRTILKL